MDNTLERLIESYRAQPSAPVFRKLDVLLDLEQLRDRRAMPFLMEVLQNPQEPLEVRLRVVRLLRLARRCSVETRAMTSRELSKVLADHANTDLRLAAALTLAEFADLPGIADALGSVALDTSENLDLRYSAFTSLERVGPTSECAVLLRQLTHDEALGPSARSLLARWQLR